MEPTNVDYRISRNKVMAMITQTLSLRSTCQRGQVGCVITKDGRIVSSGYNGALKGMEHCNVCELGSPCTHAVHAEANAIGFAAKHGISLEGCKLYCTHSPCINCAFLIAQSGIKEVFYIYNYRDTTPMTYLHSQGIECIAIKL